MIEFTKEEVNLCKQVAERYRKRLKFGDWYYFKEKVCIIWSKPEPIMDDNCIPLWTIFDCLEFLEKKIGVIELWRTGRTLKWMFRKGDQKWWSGKTPLEACLRAVLAVFENK